MRLLALLPLLLASGCNLKPLASSSDTTMITQTQVSRTSAPTPLPPAAVNTQPLSPGPAARPNAPAVFRGSGVFARPSAAVGSARTATSVATAGNGDVTLDFVNTDVREVARAVLGDVLHLNYVVDPKLQGTVTVETSRPIPQQSVLPTLEAVLRASGVALVATNGVYRLTPLEDAAHGGGLAVGGGVGGSGYGIQVLPLKYIAAAEMAKIVEPFEPPGGVLQVDAARNTLILSGSRQDLANFADLANTFDVNMLAGMSVGIYPLQVSSPRAIASELGKIIDQTSDGPMAGMVRIVPIERLNSIMVVSKQPAYLDEVRSWIARLDFGSDDDTPQLYHYFVQNSRATDLANVLSRLFGGSSVQTAQSPTAPGTTATQLGQPFPGSGAGNSSSGLSNGSGATSGAAAPRPAQPVPPPLAAATDGNVLPASASASGDGGLELPQVRVVADDKNNALIVFAKPRDYRMIENTIKRLDIVPLQVVIEATIAEVTLNNELQFGLQYFFKQGTSQETLSSLAAGSVSPVFPGFNYVLSGMHASVVLNALSAITHVNVVSSPSLMVLDHQSAVLQVGDQVPIPVQQSQSTTTADAPLINSIDYRDTGVILRVSPRVNSSGLVMLDISQEVSDVTNTTSSSLNAPTIEQRRIQSTVSVQDGETLALGGLIKDSRTRIRGGVPYLASLPVVGALFRNTDDTDARTELLVLLSPHVIRNTGDARAITEELRSRMHDFQPPPPLAR